MLKIIPINRSVDVIVEKLNEVVRTKVDIKDKIGQTNYFFWGEKIAEKTFLWESARHVNNFFRISGEIIDKDPFHSEIHIKLVNRPSYYFIYALSVWFLLIAFLSRTFFFAIFAVVFIVYSWMTKNKYFDDVAGDIKKLLE